MSTLNETTTITLTYPVTVDGTTYDTLTLRRPKVRDQRLVARKAKSELDGDVHMFVNLCEVPENVIDAMELTDFMALQEAYSNFLS